MREEKNNKRAKTSGSKNALGRGSKRTKTKTNTNTNSKTKAKTKSKPNTKTQAKTKTKETSRKNAPKSTGRSRMSKAVSLIKPKAKPVDELKIIPIGGLNEIGKNMTLVEYKDQILIIDCGMSFPEDDMFGIDVVIPDFTYLAENAKKVIGAVITHGHEDHIGAIPYLLKMIKCPIYGTPITLGLIDNKLKEHGINGDLRVFKAGETKKIGKFTVESIRTTHSVADAVCFYITTPGGSLFHTGDFKIDYTPTDGEPIDLKKFAKVGDKGVDIMLCDSTNVLRPGFTKSEKVVGETLDGIFRQAKGRILIATFSSNVNRIQKIIELTAKYGRSFAVSGRSMEKVVTIAQELGYLKIPRGSFIQLNQAERLDDNKVVIITTGSQGEPMSALARMANDEHRNVHLKKGDMVILSSTPVPGNEKSVSKVVNKLYEKEVRVIYNEILDIHVSGHACQEELKIIHSLIKPKYFMPAHGETRHLIEHGKLAESMGMKPENIFILANGDQLSISKKKAVHLKNIVSADDIMVDGLGIGDVGSTVLRERKLLSTAGLFMVNAAIDTSRDRIITGPEIESLGFVYMKENEELKKEAISIARKVIEANLSSGDYTVSELRDQIKTEIKRFINKKTKRSPVIIINIMEI